MTGRPRDVRLGQVLALRGNGQLEAALDLVDIILDLAPDAPGPLQQRMALLRALGEPDEARATEDHLMATSPGSAAACLLQGRRAYTAGLMQEAEQALRTAVQQEPALVGARYLLGRLLLEQGRLDEAEVQLGTAQAFAPELAGARGLLARVAEERAARGTASAPGP